nr:MAG TPA: hypothetical protein [Caudoviricetes sp.]
MIDFGKSPSLFQSLNNLFIFPNSIRVLSIRFNKYYLVSVFIHPLVYSFSTILGNNLL